MRVECCVVWPAVWCHTLCHQDEDEPTEVKPHVYKGQVLRLLEFGAIISLEGHGDGWIDPRELQESCEEIIRAADLLKRNQACFVRIIGVGSGGMLKLSLRGVDQRTGKARQFAVQPELSTPRSSRPSVNTAPPSPQDVLEEWDEHQDRDGEMTLDARGRTNEKFDKLVKDIQDRFEMARRQALTSFEKAAQTEWMKATLELSKALCMLDLYPPEQRHESWKQCMSEVYANRSHAHLQLMQWALAEDDCANSLQMNPEADEQFVAQVRYRRAVASEKLGNLMQALEDAESVLRFKPDSEAMSAMRNRIVTCVASRIDVQLAATEDPEIRHRLWKSLMLKWHPDKNPNVVTAAGEVCKRLNAWRPSRAGK
ncbi:pnp [Symbiodinium pilosum]|uniref:Pnp protein n=1 Tax=Symbiodinium pilosum TaxID=2952 RepID=A0A812TXD3_SYMPI|nr:pnp [Symbiodinium pilosum]